MRWKLLSVLVVLLITLMACGGGNEGAQQGTQNPNIDPTRNTHNTGDGMGNDNRNYMMEREADRNQGRGGQGDGMMNNNRMNQGDGMMGEDQGNRGDNQYDVSEEAAERITDEIDEIDNVYVITTENNAYVAANLDIENDDRTENRNQSNRSGNDHELSDDIERRIGEIVRSVDNEVDNVYVSTNPDFLNLITNYTNDMDEGRPIGGMFDQIGEMVDRLFPDNVTR
jgi:YhcN/YlaJ family sporulation lipoprotein